MKSLPQIFIINLATDVVKKNHIQALCKKHNLKVEFIQAVDGKLLNQTQIDNIYSKQDAIKYVGRELSSGEIGCGLSHRFIYQKMLDDGIQTALILEDDAWFDKQLLDFLPYLNKLDKDWELLLLAKLQEKCSIWYKKKINHHCIKRPAEVFYRTHGYCITNNGAKKMLKHTNKLARPIDYYTGNSKYINLYVIANSIIFVDKELALLSSISNSRVIVEDQYPPQGLRKLKQGLRKLKEYNFIFKILYQIYIKIRGFLFIIKPIRKY